MSEILFIRHAETDLAGTFCGHSDPPVNELGHAQIAALLASLESEQIDLIYTSDLLRASTTAEALARQHDCSLVTTDGLREIHFGQWEGVTWAQIEARDSEYARRWVEDFPRLTAPGGEAFADFEQRVLSEVRRIDTASTGRRTAVVTHAGVMRVVLKHFCGMSDEQAWERTREYCSFFVCDPAKGVAEFSGRRLDASESRA